ncbi:cyclopropane-fatty-acyl-phospholipid synthase family protein [bacterium]|nr:cyclopropane-fatty-acyl-phospholipid synthase family protein [bacterium]NUN44166.1 class I SAM-dependent methyltransferase [bacterium]
MIHTLLKNDLIPDAFIRYGIRRLLRQRLFEEKKPTIELQWQHWKNYINMLKESPIAIDTKAANEQHYEVPTRFFQLVLGRHLKYSSGYWQEGVTELDRAEKDMLALTCSRADLRDGQDILELGCGWGSLSLYMAEHFPQSRITAVSNSRTQKEFIDATARQRGFNNLTIITADMNHFTTDQKFDRVVSVEMFEHMRNYRTLLAKVAQFMKDDARLFVHIFTHREYAYLFEVRDESDWMAKYFFTGGQMPGDMLFHYFNEDLRIEEHWRVSGLHYAKTSEAWLANMDRHRKEIMPLLESTYGSNNARMWWVYWRIFFMACAELWQYNQGDEWLVSHYRFRKNI